MTYPDGSLKAAKSRRGVRRYVWRAASTLIGVAVSALLLWSPSRVAGSAESPKVTVDNWYWGPENRWSWQNTRRVFPSANIGRGDGPVAPLEHAEQDLSRISFTDPVSGLHMTVEEMLQKTYTDGFIVLKDGKIVAERYFSGMAPDSPHLLMSMTKSVVGTLVGILVAEGRIRVDARVTDYVPELKGTVYDDATVRETLDMTVAARLPPDPYKAIDQAAGWIAPDARSAAGLHEFLKTLTLKNGPHGRKFLYLDPNPEVISWIIERVTHEDFSTVLQERIWSAIGAEHDGYVLLDHYQEAYTTPGINFTLRDMARFGQMMVQGGRYNGRQIVPAPWVGDIRAGGDPRAWQAARAEEPPGPQMPGHANGSYRSYWWMADRQCGRYAAIGLGAQLMVVDPVANMVIVKFSSTPDIDAGERLTLTAYHGVDAIIRALSGHGCS